MGWEYIDQPRSLGELERRLKMRYQPHVRLLNQLVDRLNAENQPHNENYFAPYFDPMDGGIKAEMLFLFEKPGPKTTSSQFVSQNNNDPTAENTFRFMRAAGIDRKRTCLWNVIPAWDEKKRSFHAGDRSEGIKYLDELIPIFKDLRVIVLVGRTAQKAKDYIEATFPEVIVCESFHPSPLAWKNHQEIVPAWKSAREKLRLNNKKTKSVLKARKRKNSSVSGTKQQKGSL